MKDKPPLVRPLLLALPLLVSSASAATLVTYVPTGDATAYANGAAVSGTGIDPLINATSITNITSGNTTSNVLHTGNSGPRRTSFGATLTDGNWLTPITLQDGGNASTASSTAEYFGFTLSTPGTETLSLTSFKFDYGYVWSNPGAQSSNLHYALFASVNGGAFSQVGSTITTAMNTTATNNQAVYLGTQTIDLTSAGLSNADSVEFRLWVGSDLATNTVASLYQNISVDGTVVPEPSIALLGGFGLLGVLRRRRA